MNIKFGLSETLVAGSAALGCAGATIPMWVFLGFALLASFFKFAMEQQEKAQQRKFLEDNADNLKNVASELGNLFGAKVGSKFGGGTMH